MHHRRPLVSTHADGEHLHESAFVGTVKGGVRLYPIDRYQSISLRRFLANVDWQSGKWPFGLPELYHIRRTKDGAPIFSSVTPKLFSRSRCPSAVPRP